MDEFVGGVNERRRRDLSDRGPEAEGMFPVPCAAAVVVLVVVMVVLILNSPYKVAM